MARSILKQRWAGSNSRMAQLAARTLGIVPGNQGGRFSVLFRDYDLDLLDAYYESRQYDGLQDWESAGKSEEFVPVRERKPRVIYNVAKVVIDRVAAKLAGSKAFPTFKIEDDDDDTQFFRTVAKAVNYRAALLEPMKKILNSGSGLVRFYLVEGVPRLEGYNTKYCYPVFDAAGTLESVEIRYVYEDPDDRDSRGEPKAKWYKLVLDRQADTLFDNPEYREGSGLPEFKVVDRAEHGLGIVQGEWFRTKEDKHSPDGYGLCSEILPFIDELNYSLSQTSQAVSYGQEPQLTVKGMTSEELEDLIKSSIKAWALGRDGEAKFLETELGGVKTAQDTREHMATLMLNVVRVVIQDPEKMTAQAQSGKALEVLNAPLVELIDELRTSFEPSIRNLLIKIAMTMLEMAARGESTILEVPDGYVPSSLDVVLHWPPIFPPTLTDIQAMAQAANLVATGNLISRESLTRWLAPLFEIEDIEEELSKIASQPPPPNPFGGIGGF
jgi:hypothetical protein